MIASLLLAADFHAWASAPPLGWNSWDYFGTTITEAQAQSQADAMAKLLKPAGWKVFTVDIQWYAPGAKGHVYEDGARLSMDGFSRLTPATEKFPSAANGMGFKKLADYVHARGLKFGIHIMRGIPRQAVKANSRIQGTTARAAEIADITSTCSWNPDMYGVDMRKNGAQAYYNSLFDMYARWGVDFVKVDDISRPYNDMQKAEIEGIRKAITRTKRPIVLSLSPGDTPIEQGAHVRQYANMWRISDDFWDRWEPLHGMFGRLDKWTPYRGAGSWPDADMLPFGLIEFGRPTKFTPDEQRTCMSLWSIARSPLILGADMTRLDAFTLALLTNREVLGVNQASANNRQLSRKDDLIVWTADVPGSADKYVGLFNAQGSDVPYDLSKALTTSRVLRGKPGDEVVEISTPLRGSRKIALAVTDGGDNWFYDHAAWLEPTFVGPRKVVKLTDLKWNFAKVGWGEARVNRTVDDKPLMLNGQAVEGIGAHAVSFIEFDVPEGCDTFRARGVLTPGGEGKGSVAFAVLGDAAKLVSLDRSDVSVSLADLGIQGEAKVRDLWEKKDLGRFDRTFTQSIPRHGAGLYRVTPLGR